MCCESCNRYVNMLCKWRRVDGYVEWCDACEESCFRSFFVFIIICKFYYVVHCKYFVWNTKLLKTWILLVVLHCAIRCRVALCYSDPMLPGPHYYKLSLFLSNNRGQRSDNSIFINRKCFRKLASCDSHSLRKSTPRRRALWSLEGLWIGWFLLFNGNVLKNSIPSGAWRVQGLIACFF